MVCSCNSGAAKAVPMLTPRDAHNTSKTHAASMFTTDLAFRIDPAYQKISRRCYENPERFAQVFTRAWFKLTRRDIGPVGRYLEANIPKQEFYGCDDAKAVFVKDFVAA